MPKRKRIQPAAEPKAVKPKEIVPEKPLREFLGHGPLHVVFCGGATGPKIPGYECMASWRVQVSPLDQQVFQETAQQVGNVQRLFHGTPADNIGAITREGLAARGHAPMFGRGIYFGNPIKAVGYGRKDKWRQQAYYILEARVALGQSLVAEAAKKYTLKMLRQDGFSSVHGKANFTTAWVGKLYHDEWVVYSSEQVQLLYVHEYQALQVEAPEVKTPSGRCQRKVVPEPDLSRGRKTFEAVLAAPKACGADTSTVVPVGGGLTIWLCSECLQKYRIREGDRIEVMIKGKIKIVRIRH